MGSGCSLGLGFVFGAMKTSWGGATRNHHIVYFKVVQMVNSMLHKFYFNFKKYIYINLISLETQISETCRLLECRPSVLPASPPTHTHLSLALLLRSAHSLPDRDTVKETLWSSTASAKPELHRMAI